MNRTPATQTNSIVRVAVMLSLSAIGYCGP